MGLITGSDQTVQAMLLLLNLMAAHSEEVDSSFSVLPALSMGVISLGK